MHFLREIIFFQFKNEKAEKTGWPMQSKRSEFFSFWGTADHPKVPKQAHFFCVTIFSSDLSVPTRLLSSIKFSVESFQLAAKCPFEKSSFWLPSSGAQRIKNQERRNIFLIDSNPISVTKDVYPWWNSSQKNFGFYQKFRAKTYKDCSVAANFFIWFLMSNTGDAEIKEKLKIEKPNLFGPKYFNNYEPDIYYQHLNWTIYACEGVFDEKQTYFGFLSHCWYTG